MSAAPSRESQIAELLERLQQILGCVGESQHEELDRRRSWLEHTIQKLADAQTDAEYVELYQEIRYALKGGMGSFVDVYLYPGADCEFEAAELNAIFLSIIEEIFSAITQTMDGGGSPS